MKKIRTFIAFKLPDNIITHVREVQKEIRKHRMPLRWVRPESIHLTLKFFGDIEPEKMEPIAELMTETAKKEAPIRLGAKGIGFFPNLRKARVMWIGLNGETESLRRFQAQLNDAFAEIGFPKEKRSFKAHLTAARIKGRIDPSRMVKLMDSYSQTEAVPFSAEELIFYKSDLKPSGAVHTPLKKVLLVS